MKSAIKFESVEHTADAALKVYGSSLNSLFAHAAEGMYALILSQFPKFANQISSFKVSAGSLEELLVSFLAELNFFLTVKQRLLFPFEELQITNHDGAYHLYCRAQVTDIPSALLNKIREIKAVTYHQLKIVKEDNGYSVTIVFDL